MLPYQTDRLTDVGWMNCNLALANLRLLIFDWLYAPTR